jgi:hypothetical protein
MGILAWCSDTLFGILGVIQRFRGGRSTMKNFFKIRAQALKEAYAYFDQYIRLLPKNNQGEIDDSQPGFSDNDIDAFRHAYVSAVMCYEMSSFFAKVLGDFQEITGGNGSSQNVSYAAKNMDYWNNAVGRKYGRKAKTKDELLNDIQNALKNGELIIDLNDPRRYVGDMTQRQVDPAKPVIVIRERDSGRNELFLDGVSGEIFDRDVFVKAIQDGRYPGYAIAQIDDISTPMSKSDGRTGNNLG